MEHKRPSGMRQQRWNSAKIILTVVGALAGECGVWIELSRSKLAEETGLDIRSLDRILPILIRHRIIGRRIVKLGRGHAALICVHPPEMQIDWSEPPRTPRVAAVLPAIRQALLEDRESTRAVARRFGVSADTVLDERRRLVPYEQGTTRPWICPKCGARLSSYACLRCSLV